MLYKPLVIISSKILRATSVCWRAQPSMLLLAPTSSSAPWAVGRAQQRQQHDDWPSLHGSPSPPFMGVELDDMDETPKPESGGLTCSWRLWAQCFTAEAWRACPTRTCSSRRLHALQHTLSRSKAKMKPARKKSLAEKRRVVRGGPRALGSSPSPSRSHL